jgi:hypothetical protein
MYLGIVAAMGDLPPWRPSATSIDRRIRPLFEGIRAGPGSRAQKVADFVQTVGALYPLERTKVTWPKREEQLRELYHSLERGRWPASEPATPPPQPATPPERKPSESPTHHDPTDAELFLPSMKEPKITARELFLQSFGQDRQEYERRVREAEIEFGRENARRELRGKRPLPRRALEKTIEGIERDLRRKKLERIAAGEEEPEPVPDGSEDFL